MRLSARNQVHNALGYSLLLKVMMKLPSVLGNDTHESYAQVYPERSVASSSGWFIGTRAKYFYLAADVVT